MSRALHFRPMLPSPGLTGTLILLVFATVGLLRAQDPPGAGGPAAAESSGAAFGASPSVVPAPLGSGQASATFADASLSVTPAMRALVEAFEPDSHSGPLTGTARMSFNLRGAYLRRGAHRFGEEDGGELASLFQTPGGGRGALNLGARPLAPGSLAGFAPQGHPGPGLRLNTTLGSLRLSYRETFNPKGLSAGGGLSQGSTAATFISSSFGDGMFVFSASTGFGGRSMAGAGGSGFGGSSMSGGISTGPKQAKPAVALRLTF